MATNVKKLKMNYAKYETAIMQQYSIGWPKSIKFVNPSQIGTVLEIRTLRDDLRSGACHWVKLTKSQLAAHVANLEERCISCNLPFFGLGLGPTNH